MKIVRLNLLERVSVTSIFIFEMFIPVDVHSLISRQSNKNCLVDVTNTQTRYPKAVECRNNCEHADPGRAL